MKGPDRCKYLIVGGGLAAAAAVDGIRSVDPDGSIIVLGDESEPPYQRPPLSKEYLQHAGVPRELLYVKPAGWFERQSEVRLERRQRALALDPDAMQVTTARGNEYAAERILLATGGRPRTLALPGAELAGVTTFRTVEDAEALRAAATSGAISRAALVGAGFIGMELAASLTVLEVPVLVVEAEPLVWPRILPSSLAAWMRVYYEERGVEFALGARPKGFEGKERLAGIALDSGTEPCDLAVVGVGIRPNDELAADAGLAVADGIQVDAFGETTEPFVYAAGDVARYPDPVFGGRVRVEHQEHAREHGRLVGRNMAGAREPYGTLSHFYSDVFDLKIKAVGRPAEAARFVQRGAPGEGPCVAFGVRGGRLHAAVLLNAASDLEACRALVGTRRAVGQIEEALVDPEVSLETVAAEM